MQPLSSTGMRTAPAEAASPTLARLRGRNRSSSGARGCTSGSGPLQTSSGRRSSERAPLAACSASSVTACRSRRSGWRRVASLRIGRPWSGACVASFGLSRRCSTRTSCASSAWSLTTPTGCVCSWSSRRRAACASFSTTRRRTSWAACACSLSSPATSPPVSLTCTPDTPCPFWTAATSLRTCASQPSCTATSSLQTCFSSRPSGECCRPRLPTLAWPLASATCR